MIEAYRTATAAAGHAPGPIVVQVNGPVATAPLDERMPLTGSAEQVAGDLVRLDEWGVDHVFWTMAGDPAERVSLIAPLLTR